MTDNFSMSSDWRRQVLDICMPGIRNLADELEAQVHVEWQKTEPHPYSRPPSQLMKDVYSEVDPETGDITVGDSAPYALDVEFDTKPHIIKAHGNYSLRSGSHYFGQIVHHPGTKAQPYLRPIVYRVYPDLHR